MYELVEVRRNEVFTNSKVIAEGTNNKHDSIQKLISKYEEDISYFGALRFEIRVLKHNGYKGSTREKVYLLNEEQATFVMTLMRNDGKGGVVVEFKKKLVEEFYKMRRHLVNKQSKAWIETREDNKTNRLKETDVIKQLVEYAKEQGSTNSDKLYITYTKLAKTVINGKRDNMTISEINTLSLIESVILQTIRIDMSLEMNYKEIYQDCKNRINQFKEITYIDKAN